MVHIGKNTRSRIVSKGISAGGSRNAYRGLVSVGCQHCCCCTISCVMPSLTCLQARVPRCSCSGFAHAICLAQLPFGCTAAFKALLTLILTIV